jgi:hypothetical protein
MIPEATHQVSQLPSRQQSNRRLAILLPMVWSFRNVVYSGVLDLLRDSDVEVHLIVHRWSADSPYQKLSELKSACSVNGFAEALPTRKGRGRSFLQGVLTAALCARYQSRTYPIFQRWYSRHATPYQRLRSSITSLLAVGARPLPIYRRLYQLQQRLYRRSYDLRSVQQQLRSLAPTWLWSTVSVANEEQPYIFAARELQIPVVTSILGFDNLTSRWTRPRFDHYLLWSEAMKATLLRILPETSPAQISVTGTPQFDFHCWQDLLWSRSKTLAKLGLRESDRYFLYGASAESLTPEEPRLVAQLVAKMGQHPVLKDCHLVVRIHPLDNWKRWQKATQQDGRTIISPAWDNTPEPDGWVFVSLDDQGRFVNTLRHSEGCINISSTISLDAAILDKPVICIDFRSEPDCPRENLYEEYEADHYLPLVESGGIRIGHNWSELISLLARAIEAPEEDREKRRRMIERECGKVDGQAAKRVAAAIVALLDSKPPVRM